jgi:uncharacterized membrane protein HdeD (DUF308 family)
MSVPTFSPDHGGRARSRLTGPGTASLAFAISTCLCAGEALILPAARTLPLAPIMGLGAVISGIVSLARKDRPRWPAVTGFVLGVVTLVLTVLAFAFILIALGSWQD